MTSWGEDGVREYLGLKEDRDLAYRDHECPECCTLETLPDYDALRGGFIDPHDPAIIHEAGSYQGQTQLAAHVRDCYEPHALTRFEESVERLESGDDLPDDLNTAGCALYWTSVWLAPEADLQPNPTTIQRAGAHALGMTEAQSAAFAGPPEPDPAYTHARPSHAAAVLRKYLNTGEVSWDGIVAPCDDPRCGNCSKPDETL